MQIPQGLFQGLFDLLVGVYYRCAWWLTSGKKLQKSYKGSLKMDVEVLFKNNEQIIININNIKCV
jgi:hypothetical protein